MRHSEGRAFKLPMQQCVEANQELRQIRPFFPVLDDRYGWNQGTPPLPQNLWVGVAAQFLPRWYTLATQPSFVQSVVRERVAFTEVVDWSLLFLSSTRFDEVHLRVSLGYEQHGPETKIDRYAGLIVSAVVRTVFRCFQPFVDEGAPSMIDGNQGSWHLVGLHWSTWKQYGPKNVLGCLRRCFPNTHWSVDNNERDTVIAWRQSMNEHPQQLITVTQGAAHPPDAAEFLAYFGYGNGNTQPTKFGKNIFLRRATSADTDRFVNKPPLGDLWVTSPKRAKGTLHAVFCCGGATQQAEEVNQKIYTGEGLLTMVFSANRDAQFQKWYAQRFVFRATPHEYVEDVVMQDVGRPPSGGTSEEALMAKVQTHGGCIRVYYENDEGENNHSGYTLHDFGSGQVSTLPDTGDISTACMQCLVKKEGGYVCSVARSSTLTGVPTGLHT